MNRIEDEDENDDEGDSGNRRGRFLEKDRFILAQSQWDRSPGRSRSRNRYWGHNCRH